MFTADGHSDVDIKRRIGMAVSRCGQLRFILNAKNIKMKTKLKIYVCGSIAIYIRQWGLVPQWQILALTEWRQCRMPTPLHRQNRVEESREQTCTLSLCKKIRRRRLSWLGHILRIPKLPSGEERLLKIAAKVQFEMGAGGDLFMDIRNRSNCSNFNNVVELASDRKIWKNLVEAKFGKIDRARRIADHKLQTTAPAFTLSPRAPAFIPTVWCVM